MIKKYLFGLFVGFVGMIGFSYGCELGDPECDNSNSLPGSFYMGSVNNIVSTNLNLSNSDGGDWRYNTDYGCKRSIFRNNGKLYFYAYCSGDPLYQGYFSKACKIYSTGGVLSISSCDESDYTEANLNEFYSLTGYNFTRYYHGDFNFVYYNQICFYNSNNHYYYCFSRQNLDNSLGIVSGESDFSQYADYSPFFGGTPSGDLTTVYCPTVGQLIANYDQNGFYSGLCYSSDKIFNGSSFVSVDPKSIFELFSSKDDFISSLNKFGTYCESSVYNTSVCAEAFSGEDLRFNLISKIPSGITALGGRKSLYTYCSLYSYDPNATTCVGSGVTPEFGLDYTVNDVVNSISNGQFSVRSPVTSGTVFDNGSGYTYSGDILTNIQQLFGKFTSLFKKQTSNTRGFLPDFIIIPFIIIVLFKLFKK